MFPFVRVGLLTPVLTSTVNAAVRTRMRTNFVRTSLRTLPGWFALYCEPEAANLIANLLVVPVGTNPNSYQTCSNLYSYFHPLSFSLGPVGPLGPVL